MKTREGGKEGKKKTVIFVNKIVGMKNVGVQNESENAESAVFKFVLKITNDLHSSFIFVAAVFGYRTGCLITNKRAFRNGQKEYEQFYVQLLEKLKKCGQVKDCIKTFVRVGTKTLVIYNSEVVDPKTNSLGEMLGYFHPFDNKWNRDKTLTRYFLAYYFLYEGKKRRAVVEACYKVIDTSLLDKKLERYQSLGDKIGITLHYLVYQKDKKNRKKNIHVLRSKCKCCINGKKKKDM